MKQIIGITIFLLCSMILHAATSTYAFTDIEREKRFNRFSQELRCLVCQNQSLADSSAELAQDLRRELYRMIKDDASDKQIIDFMVNRYGDFVLYRPPVKPSTLLLWFGPFVFLLIGAIILFFILRKRKTNPSAALTKEQQQRLEDIIKSKDN